MYKIIQNWVSGSDIKTEKRRKMAQTSAYLRARRQAYRPDVPIGFKTRTSSAYYLTTHHKY